jgi:hypothetical protein
MTPDDADPWPGGSAGRRFAGPRPLRRPWLLIAASLLLAVLSTVLWVKWSESRNRAAALQAELRQVYTEAEAIRLQATRAQERIVQLEQQLRLLETEGAGAPRPGRAAPRPRSR